MTNLGQGVQSKGILPSNDYLLEGFYANVRHLHGRGGVDKRPGAEHSYINYKFESV